MRELRVIGTFLGIITQLVFVGPPLYRNVGPGRVPTDFLSFYTGPLLLAEGALYDRAATGTLQHNLVGRDPQDPIPFVRLPFYAHVLSPIAWFSHDKSYGVWLLGMLAAYTAGVILMCKISAHAALMGAWFFPLSFALLRSQDTPLFLLFIAAASVLFVKNRKLEAGLLLAACLIKWHLLLFVPLFILLRREWRFGLGFAAGSVFLGLWSFLVAPDWPWQYFDSILHPAVTPSLAEMPNLRGLLGHFPALLWAATALIVATTALLILKVKENLLGLHCALLGSVLSAGHSYLADCVILLPLLAMLSQSRYATRWLARFIAFPPILPLLITALLRPGLGYQVVPQLALAALPLLLAAELARSSPRQLRAVSRT